MNDFSSLYIDGDRCGDCSRCVRACTVKAIDVIGTVVSIDTERCVGCGRCVAECPQGRVQIRDDVYLARQAMSTHPVRVASVSPLWVSEFPGIDASRLVEALTLLGFTHVSESALGAERVLERELAMLETRRGLQISSRCPVVVDYLRKYRPQLCERILPLDSPMLVHARMIRSFWGPETCTVHISSCVAAKDEAARHSDLVECALTFAELKRWFQEEGIDFDRIRGNASYRFSPYSAQQGLLYPLEGGMVTDRQLSSGMYDGLQTYYCSSLDRIDAMLSVIPDPDRYNLYLDLMACPGGCVGSVGCTGTQVSPLDRRNRLLYESSLRSQGDEEGTMPCVSTDCPEVESAAVGNFVSETDTQRALDSLGLRTEAEQLDCNGCGYDTCRRFAKALARGVVDRQMCVHYVRREIQAKFTTLIGKLSSGVMVVDERLRVVESNRMFASMMGSEVELMYAATPGLSGVDTVDIVPFYSLLTAVLESGEETVVRDVQIKDRILTVSVHTVQPHKMLLVICRNMLFSQVRNEEILSRTQRVIRENLATVQKIAYLLGENASRTEAILNSILESQSADHE